ncbi:Glutathione peroxidase [Cynara cardunculus var. scolymus]|uniref:Glutathione peroxidase n=1 Tax=Cynara cardunculus var. scolymus TaxID=59895 RepID=A0A118JUW8_CYNCS|nr:Glutathione peroxidase [Cynara cardunculus var. scolymus]
MASIPCSSNLTSPLSDFSKSNRNHQPSCLSLSSCSATTSVKSLLGSSNSMFFQHGFALKAGIVSGFSSISRSQFGVFATAATGKSIYDFTVKDIDRKDVPLSQYKGKGSKSLHSPAISLGSKNLVQMLRLKNLLVQGSKLNFQFLTRFVEVDVNGPFTAPVYQYLKSTSGGLLGDLVKWNFEKFLVDKSGKVVERYLPTTSPNEIEKDIRKLVAV